MESFVSTFLFFAFVLCGTKTHEFLIDDLLYETESCTGGACRFDSLEFFTREMVEEKSFLDAKISACAYFMATSLRVKFRGNVTIMQMAIKENTEMARNCIDALLRVAFSIEYSAPLPLTSDKQRTRFSALNHTLNVENFGFGQSSALITQLEVWFPRLRLKTEASPVDCCFGDVQRVGYGIVTVIEKCPEDCESHGKPWFNDDNLRNREPQHDPLFATVSSTKPLLVVRNLSGPQNDTEKDSIGGKKNESVPDSEFPDESAEKNPPTELDSYKIFCYSILTLYLVTVLCVVILLIVFSVWYRGRKRSYEEWKIYIARKKHEKAAEETLHEGRREAPGRMISADKSATSVTSTDDKLKNKKSANLKDDRMRKWSTRRNLKQRKN